MAPFLVLFVDKNAPEDGKLCDIFTADDYRAAMQKVLDSFPQNLEILHLLELIPVNVSEGSSGTYLHIFQGEGGDPEKTVFALAEAHTPNGSMSTHSDATLRRMLACLTTGRMTPPQRRQIFVTVNR